MADQLIELNGASLDEIATDAHNDELELELKGLSTNAGLNYGHFRDTDDTPTGNIKILPAPSVGPAGSTKICDGKLTIGGTAIDVTAFRLADGANAIEPDSFEAGAVEELLFPDQLSEDTLPDRG